MVRSDYEVTVKQEEVVGQRLVGMTETGGIEMACGEPQSRQGTCET